MKLKELLLPFALVVLVGAGGEAEALPPKERQQMNALAMMMSADPAAAGIQQGSMTTAKISLITQAQNAEDKERSLALFAAMKRNGCG